MAIADEQPRNIIAAWLKQRPSPLSGTISTQHYVNGTRFWQRSFQCLLSGAVLQSSMQVWAQQHDGVAKQVVLTRCGRLLVMNQPHHASDVEAHLSSNRSSLEFIILRCVV